MAAYWLDFLTGLGAGFIIGFLFVLYQQSKP